jgi:hypothetical protein
MPRSTLRLILTLTSLEAREAPASVNPDTLLIPSDLFTSPTVARSTSGDETTATQSPLFGVAAIPSTVSDPIALTPHSVATSAKSALASHEHGHHYAPPHRHPPVRVPVD